MTLNSNISLYELIKEQVKIKGRPVKVVSGWDEVTFSFRPTASYKFADTKSLNFQQFFEEYWKSVTELVTSEEDGNKKFKLEGEGEVKEAYKKFTTLFNERKKAEDKNIAKYKILDVVNEMPFLTISADLLQCLKEGLISELIIETRSRKTNKDGSISTVVQSRKDRFANSFGQFPNCKLDVKILELIEGKFQPLSWEHTIKNHPDFDICINDDRPHIELIRKEFPNKIYIVLDYKFNEDIPASETTYRLKPIISDLKDEDFVKAAEENKQSKKAQLESQLQQPESQVTQIEKK